jgi:hypothetical protein
VRGDEHDATSVPATFRGRWWAHMARLPMSWTVREPLALSVVVDQERLRFQRRSAVLALVDRSEVAAVEFHAYAPDVGLHNAELRVRFVNASYAPVVLVPTTPDALVRRLDEQGWPVELRTTDPPALTELRARPTAADGRTEPGSVWRRGMSTGAAVLWTALLAVIVGGCMGLWLYGAAGSGG